ncbi:MAG TPA: hypothetical protein VKP89_01315 [Burkholderiales bacterium]|nr:hypothetical protein [Burkholderiales bacterium]
MSPSLKYAVCGFLLAFTLCACDSRPIEVQEKPVVEVKAQLDAERNRVWLLTRQGVAVYDAKAPDSVRQVSIPGWKSGAEPDGCLPDIAVGAQGEAVVSSDAIPVLWRIDPDTLAVTRHDLRLDTHRSKGVGFTLLRYVPQQGWYLAVDGLQGTIWRIDGDLKNAYMMARELPRVKDCGTRAVALLRLFGVVNP